MYIIKFILCLFAAGGLLGYFTRDHHEYEHGSAAPGWMYLAWSAIFLAMAYNV